MRDRDAWRRSAALYSEDRPAGQVLERGPLRAGLQNRFRAGDATLVWQVFVEHGSRTVRMRLRLNWRDAQKVVKLIVPPAFAVRRRRDGMPGQVLRRPLEGNEWPVRDVVAVEGRGRCLVVVSADVYGADVQPDGTVRMTLLRSPLYAHHAPSKPASGRDYPVTEQGEHVFEIVLMALPAFREAMVLDEAERLNNPLWIAEATRGMPERDVVAPEPG